MVATRSGRDPRVNVTSPLVVKLLATVAFRLALISSTWHPGYASWSRGRATKAVSGIRAVRPKTQVPDNPLG